MSTDVHYYTLYALPKGTVESVSSNLFPHLGLEFESVSSSSWGDYTISGENEAGEVVSVYLNEDFDDGTPDYRVRSLPNHPVLISVYDTKRYKEVRDFIESEFDAVIVKDKSEPPPEPKPFY